MIKHKIGSRPSYAFLYYFVYKENQIAKESLFNIFFSIYPK